MEPVTIGLLASAAIAAASKAYDAYKDSKKPPPGAPAGDAYSRLMGMQQQGPSSMATAAQGLPQTPVQPAPMISRPMAPAPMQPAPGALPPLQQPQPPMDPLERLRRLNNPGF